MIKQIKINKQNVVVLVPAAGFIKSACNYKLASNDPSFLNIGTSLALQEIKKYISYKIILIIKKKDKKFLKLNPYKNIEIIEIVKTKNIIETIQKSLEFINTEWVLINPITSIPCENYPIIPFIEFGINKLPKEDWSSLTFNNKKQAIFHSKLDKISYGLISHPFTGKICVKTKKLEETINKLSEYEKKDLINLAKKLYKEGNIKIKYGKWLDIGHKATYPLTRISTITSRFFNVLSYENDRNIIKKKSKNISKINQEINYYKTIPADVKRYFPAIFNVERGEHEISYEMDYIGKPTLAEIYLFSILGPNTILRIFDRLNKVFDTFYHKSPIVEEEVSWIYSHKTHCREIQLQKVLNEDDHKILRKIYHSDFYLNNFCLPSLKKSFTTLKKQLLTFEKNRPLHLGHGDLCFNNILIDPIYGQINLIDPKADKYKNIYGVIDNFYDLSKLNHSIEGLYDSVVNNLFQLMIHENNKFSLKIHKPHEYDLYNKFFKDIIIDRRINSDQLKLLTGNLFLSMIPLHIDDYERMIVFALIGSIFVNKYPMSKLIL